MQISGNQSHLTRIVTQFKNTGGSISMAMSRDEIEQQVQEVLIEALGVDDDEVTTEATLMGDLGAESIDFLDIVFRLEKAFGIKIPREELFPAEDLMNNSEFIHNGKLTEKGLAELREKMPHTDLSEFEKDPEMQSLTTLRISSMLLNHRSKDSFYNLSGRMVRSQSAANFNIGGLSICTPPQKESPGDRCVGFG